MLPLTITRHNQRILARLPRAAQAADKRQFALLEKQASIWNKLNDVLMRTRGEDRTPMLLLMSTILQAVDAGIERRNAEFKAAAEAAGIFKKSAPKRTPKAKRRAPKKSPKALAQVVKLRQAFRALPKAA